MRTPLLPYAERQSSIDSNQATNPANQITLGPEEIDSILAKYKPAYRLLLSAKLRDRILRGVFRRPPRPYTIQNAEHITGMDSVALVSQLGYIFLYILAREGLAPAFNGLSLEQLERADRDSQILLTAYEFNFRNRVWDEDGLAMTMTLLSCRRRGRSIIIHMSFSIAESITGKATGVILLQGE